MPIEPQLSSAAKLVSRPPRRRDFSAESQAYAALASRLLQEGDDVLPAVAEYAAALCQAGSAGVSLREPERETCCFRWQAVSGAWGAYVGKMPAGEFPLCDSSQENETPQLFTFDGRQFPEQAPLCPAAYEVLAVPFCCGGQVAGAVWVVAHAPEHSWRNDDVQILTTLSKFAAAALQLPASQHLFTASHGLASQGHSSPSLQEVVERQRAFREEREALRESEQRFRKIFAEGPLGMMLIGLDYRMLTVNEMFCRMVGYSPEQLRRMTFLDVTHPDDVLRNLRLTGEVFSGKRPSYQVEKRLLRSDGQIAWINVTCTMIRDGQGRPLYGLKMVQDIGERRRAEEALREARRELEKRVQQRTEMLRASNQALRESELRFRAIFDQTFQFLGLLQPDGQVIVVNQTALDFAGVTLDQVEGRPFWETYWWTYSESAQTALKEAIARAALGEFVRYEVDVRGTGDRLATIDFSLKPVYDDHGRVSLLIPEGRDITDRKKLQREVLRIAAEEQRRIGQDLHDGTGQELTGLAYMTQSLAERLAHQSLPEAALAEKVYQGLTESLKQVRILAKGLVPVDVDAEGLMAALDHLAVRSSDVYGIRCSFQCEQPVPISDNTSATHLYRIAQEAVTNAVKHAHCDEVVMTLQADGKSVTLKIQDNGIGIGQRPKLGAGVGLRIMGYRANLIGASLALVAAPQGGTVVTCTICKDKS